MQAVQLEGEILKCPTSWSEVTVEQFFRLRNEPSSDPITRYSIMLGVTRERIEKCRQFDLHLKLEPVLRFLNEPLKATKASTVWLNGKEWDVPKDLGKYSYVQYVRLYEKMAEATEKSGGSTVDAIPIAVGIYFQPIVTGEKFATDKAEKFTEEFVSKMPITDAAAVGNFFLKIAVDSALEMQPNLNTNRIRTRRLRRLVRWMYSVITPRSTPWPKVTSFDGSPS